MRDPGAIRAAFVAACRAELDALKPGNIHIYADGHGATVQDFLRSADAAAGPLCAPGATLGARILGAVAATKAAVNRNTNVGIVLLCAPLALAAEWGGDLRGSVARVLAQADRADADKIFQAIVLADPGGLGHAPAHDVRQPARGTPLDAMAEAAPRDSIARAWITNFAEIFEDGLPVYAQARARWRDPQWATLAAYLHFLAAVVDSHVVRNHSPAIAESVRARAAAMQQRLLAAPEPAQLLGALTDLDTALKEAAVNPGTSADLTVATIFAHSIANLAFSPPEHLAGGQS